MAPRVADLEEDLRRAADRVGEEVVETRRHLHRHPELSFAEHATAELCAERCRALGFTVHESVGLATGLVADLDSGRPGPRLMLRADTDALPVAERDDGRRVRSGIDGVMHACGHDGHVAIALGVAGVLRDLHEAWSGSVRLCFQPAEEVAGGAAPMIEGGAADGVDRVLGIHLWAPLPAGRVAVTAGPVFGSADEFFVAVRGRGGHGGMPHTAVDPVVAAAHVVVALQSLVSRETSPFAPAVVTVGRIEGGSAFNVIADAVMLHGTVRALDSDDRERLLARVAEVAALTARAHRCEAVTERRAGCPPVISDAGMADLVRQAAILTEGEEMVDVARPVTVGDDVALFLQRAPGCYYLVGAGPADGGTSAPHHSADFDIDERCLAVGVRTLARAALLTLQAA